MAKKKDSLAWLEELVEAAKAYRAVITPGHEDSHPSLQALVTAVDGYRQAIKDEVEAEMEAEEQEM